VVLLALFVAGCNGHSTSGAGPALGSSPTRSSTTSPSGTGIPDDFPLAQGLVADGDSTVSPPQHDAQGVHLERSCWRHAWPGPAVDRLVVQQVGPELGLTRELAVYADPATAAAVAERVQVRAVRCHRLPASAMGAAMDVTSYADSGTGFAHAASFAETLTGGQPGGSVFVFTRVGRAVLGVEDSGEWTRDSAARGVRDLERADRDVVARLCAFSDAGC
jgi:hypothetical protein